MNEFVFLFTSKRKSTRTENMILGEKEWLDILGQMGGSVEFVLILPPILQFDRLGNYEIYRKFCASRIPICQDETEFVEVGRG